MKEKMSLISVQQNYIFNKVLLFLFLIYFCFPKISLTSIGGFDIRILDFVSIIIIMIAFTKIRISKDLFFLLSVFLITQILIGLYFSGIISFLYVFRLFQYLLLGYSFYLLMISKYRNTFMKILITVQLSICILQYLLIFPNYDPGRGGFVYSREISGTFGTPAEFAYFLISFVAIFMGLNFIKHNFFIIPSFFSGVLFATFLMFLSSFKRVIIYIPRMVMIFAPYFLLFSLVIYFVDFDIIKNAILNPGFENSTLNRGESINPRQLDGPTTLLFRAAKFTDAFLYILNNLFVSLFGCGYGCVKGAMDSGIIRLLVEFGIIFSLVIFFTSKHIPKYTLFIIISVNFLFDAFWSSHVAPILFAGIFYSLHFKKIS